MNIFPKMNEVKEYISMPLIIINESDNVMDMVENGELYELVEKWKELYKNNYKPIMYKISMEDFNDLNSYMDDCIDTDLVYTYDDNEKVYIFSFNGELIGVTTDKEMMNKEMKSLRKLVELM